MLPLRGSAGCAIGFQDSSMANIPRDRDSRLSGSTIKANEIIKMHIKNIFFYLWKKFSTPFSKLDSKFRVIFKAYIMPIFEGRNLRAISKKQSRMHM